MHEHNTGAVEERTNIENYAQMAMVPLCYLIQTVRALIHTTWSQPDVCWEAVFP